MAANFNVRKIGSTFERISGSVSSIRIIVVPLKKRITTINFFGNKHSTEEVLAINAAALKELMTATAPVSSKKSQYI